MKGKVMRHWYAYGNKKIQLRIPEKFVAGIAAGDEKTLSDCMKSDGIKVQLSWIDPIELARELKDFYGYDFVDNHLVNRERVVSEACIELDDGSYPIPEGVIEAGMEVYWNDPGDGLSSGFYKVDEILNAEDGTIRISDGVSEAEVFFDELEIRY